MKTYASATNKPNVGARVDLAVWLGVLEMHDELARELLAFLAISVLDQS